MTIRRAGILGGLVFAVCLSGLALGADAAVKSPKQRLIVLSDVENEPDDTQSFVRLLLYSNVIDIEALVATTSVHMKDSIHPESIRRIIDSYGAVRANLLQHERGFPAAADLQSRVFEGQPGYGMGAVGEGRDTPGSMSIQRALEKADVRPLWVAVWGGANTLAQALHSMRATQSQDELRRLLSKLRVYTISDQDDSGAWIRRSFPELFYIVSPGGYGQATWGGIHQAVEGIDNESISNAWLARHIQQGHGAYGALYPDVAYGMEGDTPSFLSLIPVGLADPEHPEWGGWGGRYELDTPKRADTEPEGFTGGVPVETETRPIWTNAQDSVVIFRKSEIGRAVRPSGQVIRSARATLWRWRDEFQNDFAARMTWTTQPRARANHPPVVALAHPDRISIRSGASFHLDASGTTDPDGDSLSYLWFHYPEAGQYQTPLAAPGAQNLRRVRYVAPLVTQPTTAHFIVAVTDKGQPPLTRYRRVIVDLQPAE